MNEDPKKMDAARESRGAAEPCAEGTAEVSKLEIPAILLAIQARQRETRESAQAAQTSGLGEAMEQVGSAAAQEKATISQRLKRKFGLGDLPAKRAALYQRLEQLAKDKGEQVTDAISEAVAESVSARYPDRYFCKSIVKKLKERGLDGGSGNAVW